LKPGLTPVTEKEGSLSPMPSMENILILEGRGKERAALSAYPDPIASLS
jgi:hypothetical protein